MQREAGLPPAQPQGWDSSSRELRWQKVPGKMQCLSQQLWGAMGGGGYAFIPIKVKHSLWLASK